MPRHALSSCEPRSNIIEATQDDKPLLTTGPNHGRCVAMEGTDDGASLYPGNLLVAATRDPRRPSFSWTPGATPLF